MASVGELRLFLTNSPDPTDREYLHAGIRAHNDEISPHHRAGRAAGRRPLDILIRDGRGQLVGGLTADTYWNWLEINDLWIEADLRFQGLGRRLLALAEAEATSRGCSSAMLRTFSFQARGFCEKYGYRVVGELTDHPPGNSLYWMRKDFG